MALIGLELQASREFSAPVTLAGTFVLMQRRCTVWLGVHRVSLAFATRAWVPSTSDAYPLTD
jgi:hypothetical protein